jgi:hypothetical protein
MTSADPLPAPSSRPAASPITALVLFLVSLAVYNVNFRRVGTYDSLPASLIPMTLLVGDGISLDRYATLFPPQADYTLRRSPDGHRIPMYPIVTPLLALPIYVPFAAAMNFLDVPVAAHAAPILEKVCASLFAAASVAILFLALARIASGGRLASRACAFARRPGRSAARRSGSTRIGAFLAVCLWLLAHGGSVRPGSPASSSAAL